MSHELRLSLNEGVVLRLLTNARGVEVTVLTYKHLDVYVTVQATVDVDTISVVGGEQFVVGAFAGFLPVTAAEAAVLNAFLAMCKEGA